MAKITLDNLGIEHDNRYARDKELHAEGSKYVKGASASLQAKVLAATPSPTEVDRLFQKDLSNVSYATYDEPKGYPGAKPIFLGQLVPSLGTDEKIESYVSKIQGLKV